LKKTRVIPAAASANRSKQAFVQTDAPDVLIAQERKVRQWLPHSVALVVTAPRMDQLLLVTPAKVAGTQGEYQLSLPQQRLQPDETIWNVATKLARDAVSVQVNQDQLLYLGSARGNKFNGQTRVSYGKWVHWLGLSLGGQQYERKPVANPDCFMAANWYAHNQLSAMASSFSQRKYWMLLNALSRLPNNGPLIRMANLELQQEQAAA